MRPEHIDELRPVCPICRQRDANRDDAAAIELAERFVEHDGDVVEGVLRCTRPECQAEYPIYDSIAIVRRDARAHLQQQHEALVARGDVSTGLEAVLADVPDPGSPADRARYYASIYAWDSYSGLDPDEQSLRRAGEPEPGGCVRLLEAALEVAGGVRAGRSIDIGCGAGRSTFELALRCGSVAVGLDADLTMLRIAARAAREGVVRYPRRRCGVIYDTREFSADLPARSNVSFWCADAMDPPFASGSFANVIGLNVLDCLADPAGFLHVAHSLLAADGACGLTTPFDWTGGVTPIEGWLGGHSPRGLDGGDPASVLRRLLTPGAHARSVDSVRVLRERDGIEWVTRLHERAALHYEAIAIAFCRA